MSRYTELIRPVWAEIDLGAVRHNVREVKRLIGSGPRIMAVVKAEGYGHGAVPVASAALAAGAEWLGVSLPEEGIALREAGLTAPILVLGALRPEQAGPILDHRLTATVCQREAGAALAAAAAERGMTAECHLKVDTGMGRIGVTPDEAVPFAGWLGTLPHLRMTGVFSHLARADETDKTHALGQIERFTRVCDDLRAAGMDPGLRHLANSAAIIDLPAAHFDLVRAGIIIYGLQPSPEVDLGRVQLRPAFSLRTKVVFVKSVSAGTGLSYGQVYRTPAPSVIATIPIGYADGWTRLLTGKAKALINGRRYPVVGRICMDQCMVDLGTDRVETGAEVVLIGRQGPERISAEEIADLLGTINYEVVCMISDRVPRVYRNE